MKNLIIYLCLLIGYTTTIQSQQIIERSPNWHFYIAKWQFNWDALKDIERIDCPIEIMKDIPDEYRVYVQVAQCETKKFQMFYGGLLNNIGLFARWPQYYDQPDRTEVLKSSDVSDYENWELAWYEGNCIRVKRNFPLNKGEYLISFIKEGEWVRFKINDVTIGKINFKYQTWDLYSEMIAFFEIHSGGKNGNKMVESDEIPSVDIILKRPIIYHTNKTILKPYGIEINDWGLSNTIRIKDGVRAIINWSNKKYEKDGARIYFSFE
jgi:hypothetical protein